MVGDVDEGLHVGLGVVAEEELLALFVLGGEASEVLDGVGF